LIAGERITGLHRLAGDIVRDVRARRASTSDGNTNGDEGQVEDIVDAVAGLYLRRRALWDTARAVLFDRIFSNYCRHYWLREWYPGSTDLRAHVQKLLVRVALLRMLTLCHPRLAAGDADPDANAWLLAEVAVEVIYKF